MDSVRPSGRSPAEIDEMIGSLPTLLSVSGVYQYFHEEKIIENIRAMKKLLPEGELIFDATNSDGLKFTNKFVQKTGNLDAMMYFGLDDPEAFSRKCGTDKWKRVMIVRMKLNSAE